MDKHIGRRRWISCHHSQRVSDCQSSRGHDNLLNTGLTCRSETAPIPKIVYEDFDESFPGFDESSVQSEHHTEYTESIPESPATDRILNLSNSDLQDLPTDNVRLTAMEPQKTGGFLISFLVDARGGILESRQSGIRVLIPKGACRMPTRVTCRLCRYRRKAQLPQLNENEAVVSRVMEISPAGTEFLRPVIIELPHFGSLRGRERELIILRNDLESDFWREHLATRINSDMYDEDHTHDMYSSSPEHGTKGSGIQFVRIVTQDIPKRFVVVSRPKKENFLMLPEGGILKAAVDPETVVEFPESTLNMSTKLLIQVQPIDESLLPSEEGLHISPILNIEPFTRLIRPIAVTIPCRWLTSLENRGIPASCLHLIALLPRDDKRDARESVIRKWTDITERTSLTVVGNKISFQTTFLTKYWVVQTKFSEAYMDQLDSLLSSVFPVPFIAKFVVFGHRLTADTAELRVFCMTDDKVEKTLEHQEGFAEIARSRDLDIYDGQTIYIKCSGNMSPAIQNLKLTFRPFRENRLAFKVSSLNSLDPWSCKISCIGSLRQEVNGKVPVLCNLEARLVEEVLDTSISNDLSYQVSDDILQYVARSVTDEWVDLAQALGLDNRGIQGTAIISAGNEELAALTMLETWRSTKAETATFDTLRDALYQLGRQDIAHVVDTRSPAATSPSGHPRQPFFDDDRKIENQVSPGPIHTSEKITGAEEKLVLESKPSSELEKTIEPILTSEKVSIAEQEAIVKSEPTSESEKNVSSDVEHRDSDSEKEQSTSVQTSTEKETAPRSIYHGLPDYIVVDFADQVPEEEQKMIPDEDKIDVEAEVEVELDVIERSTEEQPSLMDRVKEMMGQTSSAEEIYKMEISYDNEVPQNGLVAYGKSEVSYEEEREKSLGYQSSLTTTDEDSRTASTEDSYRLEVSYEEGKPLVDDVSLRTEDTSQGGRPLEITEEEYFVETRKEDKVEFSDLIDDLAEVSPSEDRTLVNGVTTVSSNDDPTIHTDFNEPSVVVSSNINSNISNGDSRDSGVSVDMTTTVDSQLREDGSPVHEDQATEIVVNGDEPAKDLVKEMFAGDSSILAFFETSDKGDKTQGTNLGGESFV